MPKKGQKKGTPARRAEFIAYLRTLGEGDECVFWPWSQVRGRPIEVFIDGVKRTVHRWVFEQVSGRQITWTHQRGARGDIILHLCDNPPCVRPSHLRLGTQQDNIRDAVAKGRMGGRATYYGGGRRKLSDDDCRRIRSLAAAGVVQRRMAEAFGVSEATISEIVLGRRRTMLPRKRELA